MPRYFFHTADGSRKLDNEGTELKDHGVARVEAIKFSAALINDEPDVLSANHDFRVEVTDVTGMLLFTVVTLAIDSPAVMQL